MKELIEKIKEHPVFFFFSIMFAVAAGTWAVSENIRVKPLDREIAFLRQQLEDTKKNIVEIKTAQEPYQKQIEQLSTKNQKLENDLVASQNNLVQAQDTLNTWKTQNSDLEKKLNRYATNCSIISEIHALDERKSSFEKKLEAMKTPIRWMMPEHPRSHVLLVVMKNYGNANQMNCKLVFLVFSNGLSASPSLLQCQSAA